MTLAALPSTVCSRPAPGIPQALSAAGGRGTKSSEGCFPDCQRCWVRGREGFWKLLGGGVPGLLAALWEGPSPSCQRCCLGGENPGAALGWRVAVVLCWVWAREVP